MDFNNVYESGKDFCVEIFDAYEENISGDTKVDTINTNAVNIVDDLNELLKKFEGFSIIITDKSEDKEIYVGTFGPEVLDYIESYLD